MSGSSSSGSGSSNSGSPRTAFSSQCGGKPSSMQCVGVQGVCNLCGQLDTLLECVRWSVLSILLLHHKVVQVDRPEAGLSLRSSSISRDLVDPA
ncbi:hypothetical protein F511_09988 [Dorcoceras hygrometricum]|uniref:Uncharacterized protein n=1 Tax=Dorcoceras hygrometricum TaxID=472368 RepID=A0A2Z7AMZ4_9LAMI|nr:hypothetical protein F511_09988 [Dorcoceras hygrometricum]